MKINEIKPLIKKMLREELTIEEIQKLSNEEPLKKLMMKQWDDAPDYHRTDLIEPKEMWSVIYKNSHKSIIRQKKFFRWGYSAAAIILLFLIGFWMTNYVANSYITIVGKNQDRTAYVLPDSSKVWINKGSSISYKKNFLKDRTIKLEGEALFSVRKRHGALFSVYTHKSRVVVKGTEFNINSKKNQTEVTLFKGKVSFNIIGSNAEVEMNPNDQIIYNLYTGEVTKKKVDIVEYDWRLNEYSFTGKSLKELVEFLYRLHGVEIAFENKKEEKALFTGVIRKSESLSETLDKICFSFDMKYKKDKNGKTIIIY